MRRVKPPPGITGIPLVSAPGVEYVGMGSVVRAWSGVDAKGGPD